MLMVFQLLLLFRHLSPELIHDHIGRSIKVGGNALGLIFASPLKDLHIDNAFMAHLREHYVHIHRLHFEFEEFFKAGLEMFD